MPHPVRAGTHSYAPYHQATLSKGWAADWKQSGDNEVNNKPNLRGEGVRAAARGGGSEFRGSSTPADLPSVNREPIRCESYCAPFAVPRSQFVPSRLAIRDLP